MPPAQAAIAIECYIQGASLTDRVRTTVETLQEYERAGIVDDLTVQAWPDEVPLTDAPWRIEAVERFETFRAWADRHGVRIWRDIQPNHSPQTKRVHLHRDTARG